MFDAILKLYDSFSDATKRFEDRVLQAAQLLGQCHNSWFLDLSKSLHPLMAYGDIRTTYNLYSSFIYEQSKYQLPATQGLSILLEAEKRMKDEQVQFALARIRLGTFLVFRWLDTGYPQYGSSACSFCSMIRKSNKSKFGQQVTGTWALLKLGNEFFVRSAIPLEEFLRTESKIELPDAPPLTIDEIRAFLTSQMDAINSLLSEMAKDIGIILARSDFLRGIDLNSPARPAMSLSQLQKADKSMTKIFQIMADVDRVWNAGLLTDRQEQISLLMNLFDPNE